MLIRSAYIQHVLPFHPEVTHVNIRWHINTGKVADMHGTVRIRQRTGHKSSFVVSAHIFILIILSISACRRSGDR